MDISWNLEKVEEIYWLKNSPKKAPLFHKFVLYRMQENYNIRIQLFE